TFKRLKYYFLGKAIALNDDPFENVKVEVLFNFSIFFLFINLPYTFLSLSSHPAHFISALFQNASLLLVVILIKQGKHIKFCTYFFTFVFAAQTIFHF